MIQRSGDFLGLQFIADLVEAHYVKKEDYKKIASTMQDYEIFRIIANIDDTRIKVATIGELINEGFITEESGKEILNQFNITITYTGETDK